MKCNPTIIFKAPQWRPSAASCTEGVYSSACTPVSLASLLAAKGAPGCTRGEDCPGAWSRVSLAFASMTLATVGLRCGFSPGQDGSTSRPLPNPHRRAADLRAASLRLTHFRYRTSIHSGAGHDQSTRGDEGAVCIQYARNFVKNKIGTNLICDTGPVSFMRCFCPYRGGPRHARS